MNTKLFNDLGDCSLLGMPVTWVATTHAVYLEHLRKQLVKIDLLNDEARDLLISNLRIRKSHPWGREVVSSQKTGHLGLRNGDRLVTGTDVMPTLHDLNSDLATPTTIWFFRLLEDSCIAGVSLLWDVPEVHGRVPTFRD